MSNAVTERAEAAKLPQGDVTAVLLTQHARIRDLFTEVRQAQGEHRKKKFNELRALLAVHETAEEMIVRPAARKAAGEEEVRARNAEEDEANHILAELEDMDVGSPVFVTKLMEFEHAVSDHAEHEEREEFPALRRSCSDEHLQSMGRRLLRVEKAAPTHPHPGAAGSTAAQWTVGPFAALVDRVKDTIDRDERPS
ncbi:hemerythrin domain-containing protein [Streptomyces cacaoi]|uniref:hemerythrin domain-containing protein n=1 Tax=Streptomyces cacaoi TaxID=1898 RepID=UPI00374A782B